MSVEQATAGGTGVPWLQRVARAPIEPRTWTAAAYLVASMAVGIFWFVVLVSGISVGLSLVIIWVGLPILALTMLAWRGGAWLERRWVGLALGARIPEPYRPLPTGGLLARWLAMAADPATWKDFAYLVLLFPLGIAWFVITVTLWSFALSLLTVPIYYRLLPNARIDIVWFSDRPNVVLDTLPEALAAAVLGLLLCLVAAWATRGMAVAHAAIAQGLLGPSPAQLRARVAALQASRDHAVDSAEDERRRIERDLHDGAQQRLVALAMDLGMAREKLRTDPQAATAPSWSARRTRRPSAPSPSCATWRAASTRRCWPTGGWTRRSPRWPPARPSPSGWRSSPSACPARSSRPPTSWSPRRSPTPPSTRAPRRSPSASPAATTCWSSRWPTTAPAAPTRRAAAACAAWPTGSPPSTGG